VIFGKGSFWKGSFQDLQGTKQTSPSQRPIFTNISAACAQNNQGPFQDLRGCFSKRMKKLCTVSGCRGRNDTQRRAHVHTHTHTQTYIDGGPVELKVHFSPRVVWASVDSMCI